MGILLCGLALIVSVFLPSAAAAAEAPGRGWQITSSVYPTELEPGAGGFVYVQPLNVGAASTSGQVKVIDQLPAGVTATEAGSFRSKYLLKPEIGGPGWSCSISPGTAQNSVVSCSTDAIFTGGAGFPTPPPGERFVAEQTPFAIAVNVAAAAGESASVNQLAIEGGGAAPVTAGDPLQIGNALPSFGLSRWDGWFSNADGTLDTQAGSVPYSASFSFDLDALQEEGLVEEPRNAGGEVHNIIVKLPPGFLGDPLAVPRCTRQQFFEEQCPTDSLLGSLFVYTGALDVSRHVFNLLPPPGVAAEFGFEVDGIPGYLNSGVRTGGDYGITTTVNNSPQKIILGSVLTLWGVPHDPTHNRWRQGNCTEQMLGDEGHDGCYLGPHPELKPFLRLPTSCAGPAPFTISASSWLDASPDFTEPLAIFTHGPDGEPEGLTGCNKLLFEPTIETTATTAAADSPTGLRVDLRTPQPQTATPIEEEVGGETRTVGAETNLAEADLKDAVVMLPNGIVVNPSSANGLGACTEAQFGLTSAAGVTPVTTTPGPATCPDDAKIGSVEIDTPLLDHPLEGAVYVATPQQNPFGSLLALYIAVDDPATGTVIKLAGKVEADPVTGRLTASFDEAPQLPFEDFQLGFFGGAGAALRTPQTCGTYAVASDMTPWSTPEGADAHPADSFQITQAPGGGSCPTQTSQLPNAPGVTAGTLQPKAGAYSPFVLHLVRSDGTQELTRVETTLPEGLLAKLAGVTECSSSAIAQAESRRNIGEGALEQEHPSCPSSSEVGIVHVGAGAGPTPYYVSGHAYLAGPYKGAPLSLAIVTPAVAGPYDLGNVVVRTALKVDPLTAQVDAVSDEFPHILQGIPLDIRSIGLELSRPDFTINPTSCEKKSITGSIGALGGASSAIQLPFQVGECKALAFAPKLKLSLKGSTKHVGHPALNAVLTYPKGGAYANIARAQVNLPHSEFIDQANLNNVCTHPVLLAGACPASTIYGHAKAWTPLEEAPLEGPVFLVGGFGYKLPALVAELNGQIRVLLAGKVDSGPNHGIRNTFEAVPDAPVERFELNLKGGPKYSLLENSEDLCAKPQKAIARFTAQNGAVFQSKPLIANQCGKKKKSKGYRGKKGSKNSKGSANHKK